MKKVKKQAKEVIVMKHMQASDNRNLFFEALSNMEWNSMYVNSDTRSIYWISQ